MINLESTLKGRDITLLTMFNIIKALFFPVVTNGCENWIIKKVEQQRIDAFKLWCWRRLLRALLGRKVMTNLDSIREKWKWSRSVVSDPQRPHGLQSSSLLRPWDFPGKSTGVGCHCLLRFKSRDITFPTKICLIKAMVFPVVMYGCKSWTVKKAERWRIDAFELWCWRRLLTVP